MKPSKNIVEEILEFIRTYEQRLLMYRDEQPSHPQLIEGRFYVTQQQFKELRKHYDDSPIEYQEIRVDPLRTIPVEVLRPNVARVLPSGKILIYTPALDDAFLIFDSKKAENPFSSTMMGVIDEDSSKTPTSGSHWTV